jgi:hypothetical protein
MQKPRILRFSQLGDFLETCHTPFFKFVGHMASFVGFLTLVIYVIANDSGITPTPAEAVRIYFPLETMNRHSSCVS